MFDVMADWMAVPLINSEAGNPPKRMALAHPSIAPYGVFNSKDGKGILISIQSEREWKKLCAEVLDQPDLPNDPRFANMVERVRNRAAHRQDGGRQFCRDDARRSAEAPGRRRYRVRRGQHHGRPRRASASAQDRGRYAERQGELRRARRDLRRREPGTMAPCPPSATTSNFPKRLARGASSHDRKPPKNSTSTICANGSAAARKRQTSSPRNW